MVNLIRRVMNSMRRLSRVIIALIMVVLSCYLLGPGVGWLIPKVIKSFVPSPGSGRSNSVASDCSVPSSNETQVTTQTSATVDTAVPGNVPASFQTHPVHESGVMAASAILQMELVFKIRNLSVFQMLGRDK